MLQLQRIGQVWLVHDEKSSVAEIYLDYADQVGQIIVNANTSEDNQLEVLRLVAHHAHRYVKNRSYPVMGGLITYERRNNNLTREDSYRLMDFALISNEIKKLTREEIIQGLRSVHVEVVNTVYATASDSIQAAIANLGIQNLRFEFIPQRVMLGNELSVRFEVEKPNCFTFWKNESEPGHGSWDLHIVPSYHPVMNGWEHVGMVNGETDAYIRGSAIRSIHCPEAARAEVPGRNVFGSTFGHVKHPYKAIGHSVEIEVTPHIRSREGMAELTAFLRGALNVDKKYVSINGGFRAPFECAHNRLLRLGRKSPWPRADYRSTGNVARGSEQHCVWAHRVLTQEGVLEKSYVPSWFTEEGWLGIYEGATMQHGLF